MSRERIILGIDPGTTIMGYSVISVSAPRMELLTLGALKLSKYDDHYLRLKIIFERVISLTDQYKPDELAIEAPFFGKNVQSMLKLGRAQGVAISAALSKSIPIFEYSPRRIKQSITGKGGASKEQVASMLQRILLIKEVPETLDATDALAVAVCHFFQKDSISSGAKFGGWKDFISANPGRLK
ncbi:MAG: crossover junction endodeoxyribonuclease RuvC [bacterium]